MDGVYLGIGAVVWLVLFVLLIFFGILSILMPWFVYKIRLEVKEIKEHLIDMKEIIANLSTQHMHKQEEHEELSPEVTYQEPSEDSPIVNPDIRNPQAKEVPYKDKDDDILRYAPPEYKK